MGQKLLDGKGCENILKARLNSEPTLFHSSGGKAQGMTEKCGIWRYLSTPLSPGNDRDKSVRTHWLCAERIPKEVSERAELGWMASAHAAAAVAMTRKREAHVDDANPWWRIERRPSDAIYERDERDFICTTLSGCIIYIFDGHRLVAAVGAQRKISFAQNSLFNVPPDSSHLLPVVDANDTDE